MRDKQLYFDDKSDEADSPLYNYLPEDPSVVIGSVKALVCRHHSVEQALAGVETAQALDQPSVPWNECLQFLIHSAVDCETGRIVRWDYCVPNISQSGWNLSLQSLPCPCIRWLNIDRVMTTYKTELTFSSLTFLLKAGTNFYRKRLELTWPAGIFPTPWWAGGRRVHLNELIIYFCVLGQSFHNHSFSPHIFLLNQPTPCFKLLNLDRFPPLSQVREINHSNYGFIINIYHTVWST